MALGDPTAMQPWSWVPPEWQQPAPGVESPPMPTIGSPVLTPEQPEAAPTPQQLGPVGLPPPVDEVPMPAMPPAPVEPEEIQFDAYGMDQATAVVPDMPAMPGADDEIEMPAEYVGSALPPVGPPRSGVDGQQPLDEDELLRLYKNDPVAFAAHNEQQNAERDNKLRAREAEMAQQQTMRAEQDWADYQKAKQESDAMLMQLDQDAQALAAEKPKKYQPGVLDLAAAVLGMIGAPATGGQNVGLAMVNKRIDDDWAMQKEEYERKRTGLDVRRNMYARLRQAGYDDFQATSAFRMAHYARAKEQLLTEMQNYDPQGTTARRIAGAAIQMDQQIASARTAAAKADLDRRTAEADLRKKQAEAFMAQRKAGMIGGAGTGAGAGAGGPEQVKPGNLTAAEVNDMIKQAGGTATVQPKPGGFTTGEARGHVELSGKVTEEGRKTKKLYVGGIVNADGTPLEFASDAEGDQFRKQAAAMDDLNALIGEMSADIDAKGGTVGFVNSGLNKKYQSRLARIDLILKEAFKTGTLDEGTEKKLQQLKGGNVTSLITGGTEGLDTLRDDLVRGMNMSLRRQPNYAGAKYDPPYKPRLPKADAGPDGQRLEQTIKANYLPAKTIDKVRTGKAGPEIDLDPLGSKEAVDTHLENLERRARKNDDDARDAKETLRAIEAKAVNQDVKKRAAEILKSIPVPRGDTAR